MNRVLCLCLALGIFFTSSCSKHSESNAMIDALTSRWISVHHVSDLTGGLVISENTEKSEITRPPNAWIPVVEVRRWNDEGEARDCLFYKTPFKEHLGHLKLIELRSPLDSCAALPNPDGELGIAEQKNVENLSVQLKNFNLTIWWRFESQDHEYVVPLYNLKKKKSYQLYGNSLDEQLIAGLTVLTLGKGYPATERLGKLSDRNEDQSAITCHQVDENCISLTKNNCDQCRFGWYSTAQTQCPQGGTKICGVNRCGKKGEFACPRGLHYRNYKMDYACIDDSPAAFCGPGLRVMCDGQKRLICQ